MGRNYHAKWKGALPSGQNTAAQKEQARRHHKDRIAIAYQTQDLPEVILRDGNAYCPYAAC
jgi:hypothetical protein